MNIWLVLTICPHKRVDTAKSHDDLPAGTAVTVMYYTNFLSLLVLPTDEWHAVRFLLP